jgi:translation initiation factor IF-3
VDEEGTQVGIVPTEEALQAASDRGLDLVEVAPDAKPPVCRIMDYGKYKYELSKKEKASRKRQHTIQVKEIRFRPKIEEHDLMFKVKHARKFLEEGNRVKMTVRFRGREMAHREFGAKLLERITEELDDVAKVEREPQMEGRLMVMYMAKK